ncbi:LacI family transcriptional regulator [Clostridium tetanomorphum]|uniref:LacI family transcriptional regulator n=1 Tax=Clostridium tetanomorphum TaxID=1553 RepID=A0A923EAZ8_CLOTT|nr:LacI family DNA-binding transcriptional regulator [Clostridium tetanomorphum]KAJ53428.1 LacI family transcription regulator [Clostridium tetanomorphum DSM 665]MBC2398497.1 LacI family transcriptional regulator [Clostridium tetanomorphum]MBP1865343.1 LacI family transcriptional regulator [Clostridium tetanomorphum]NRS85266.1 LacI family transcriptional regulator [Clostridium tetanomorphum]NRZ98443.1 LacI family transcriptional regulator [Clostridium tetanomorphum]
MKITIEDVAKEAGVSITTVSRVINNNYPVKKETRKKVEEAIEKLKFNPNVLARGLINQKTDTVGIIVPSTTNLFFPTVVKGIDNVLKKQGYNIYLCDTDNSEKEEVRYVKSLLGRVVDGIIIIDPQTFNMKNGFFEEISRQVPLVCINGYNKNINCNFVLNNEETGAIEAMEYLISLGHKKIAFIRGEKSYSYDLKEKVYKDILKKYGYDQHQEIINIGYGNSYDTVDTTMKYIEDLLNLKTCPTAFFACNDIMALGTLNACKKKGLDVPEYVSIVGFDNIIISRLSQPKITTVDQNMYQLGKYAAEMLLNIINTQSKKVDRIILNTKLIMRDSCKRARKEEV